MLVLALQFSRSRAPEWVREADAQRTNDHEGRRVVGLAGKRNAISTAARRPPETGSATPSKRKRERRRRS